MKKGQTSIRGGVQDLLCPFEYVAITQASDVGTHKGTRAVDIGYKSSNNPKEPYYAPCDLKCVWTYPSNGQALWQSINKVRFADGSVDYLTFVTAHDNSFNANAYEGQIVKQGVQLGNKGDKGNASGIHCHIECAKGKYDLSNWKQNNYGIYCLPNEIDIDSVFFMDNTEVKNTLGTEEWKYLKDVPVEEHSSNDYVINAYGDRIEVGCKVSVRANWVYGGKEQFVVNYDKYDVIEVSGERVVIGIGNVVTTAIHCDNLKRV